MKEVKTGVSYFGNLWPKHFTHDLEDMIANGCTYVVHTVHEQGFIYNRDAVEKLFRVTKDIGLECWADPWAVLGLFGGEAFSGFVARNPDDCQVLSNGMIAPAGCPSADNVRRFMKQWILFAVNAGADVLFWDEPLLYDPSWDYMPVTRENVWSCRCSRCKMKYKDLFKEEMPLMMTKNVRTFRKEILTDFLKEMIKYASMLKVKNAVCLLPVSEVTRNGLSWETIANIEGLDILGTDPYWRSAKVELIPFVQIKTEKLVSVCKKYDIESQIWVQGFGIPEGAEFEVELALETANNVGVDYLAVWGYRGCEIFRSRSARPDIVWDTIGSTFNRIRDKVPIVREEIRVEIVIQEENEILIIKEEN